MESVSSTSVLLYFYFFFLCEHDFRFVVPVEEFSRVCATRVSCNGPCGSDPETVADEPRGAGAGSRRLRGGGDL